MKVFEFPFGLEIGNVVDVDFTFSGAPVSIQGTPNHQVLMWNQQRYALPPAWSNPDFPFVRSLHDGRVLVVDTNFEAGKGKNAWILRLNGSELAVDTHFEIGAAVVEIVALWGLIAVAFHPISAKAHGHPILPVQKTGVAFYDLQGRLVMGFNQEASRLGVICENVRCLTALSRTQIMFAPEKLSVDGDEVENPIVLFDCASRRPTLYSAPYPRPEAISMADGLIHLASPETWEDQIITFDPEKKISQHRGEFLGIFRGLEGGAFLSQLSNSDYVVVVPETPDVLKEASRAIEARLPAPAN